MKVLRRCRLVLDDADVDEDLVADPLLPPVWLFVQDGNGREAIRRPVGEDQPDLLRGGAWVLHPSPQVDMSGVERLHQLLVDALECTLAADDALNVLRRPSMARDAIEVEPHMEENAHP